MSEEQPNLSYIDKLAGEDMEFKQRLLTILKEEFPLEQIEYLDSAAVQNAERAAFVVHKLKHKFNILGMQQGYRLAVDYEKALQGGDFGLDKDFTKILGCIGDYLKTVKT